MSNKVIVVKIGGSTLGSHDTTIEDIVTLQQQGKSLLVVHGGGKIITDWLAIRGVSSRFVRGERVTDKETLEVVVSVLAGLVNKEIVADINRLGGRAVGISGVDGAIIQGTIKDAELGFVGTIVKVDMTPLMTLMQVGYIPVVAPLSIQLGGEHGGAGQILNVNADTVAGEIAAAACAERLIFLTDVAGILDKSGGLLPKLSAVEAQELMISGVASGGMIPKIKACLKALSSSSTTCIIDGRQPHALLRELTNSAGGTVIQA